MDDRDVEGREEVAELRHEGDEDHQAPVGHVGGEEQGVGRAGEVDEPAEADAGDDEREDVGDLRYAEDDPEAPPNDRTWILRVERKMLSTIFEVQIPMMPKKMVRKTVG